MVELSDGRGSSTAVRRLLLDLAAVGIESVQPERFLPEIISSSSDPFWARCRDQPYAVLAMGKASESMVAGSTAVLGAPAIGVIATHVPPTEVPGEVEAILGGHPVPDAGSLVAGRRMLEVLKTAPGEWPLVILISGGASALCEALRPGVGLDDLRMVTEGLLRSGLPISDCNVVRQALSRLKGGGLAAAVGNRAHRALVVSDVVGSSLEAIASGPLTAPTWRVGDPWDVVPEELRRLLRPSVAGLLRHAAPGRVQSDAVEIVADGGLAASAVRDAARRMSLEVRVESTALAGDAADTVIDIATSTSTAGGLRVFTGETTVQVAGSGVGGRNQHAALTYALHLADLSANTARAERAGLMLGTDGRDGPTDAAGALVDHESVGRIIATGLNPRALLDDNDSHRTLDAAGDLVRTGPTGTNVGDLWLLWN